MIRIKIGKHLSVGKTGLRVHVSTPNITASTGGSGTRLFGRIGPVYGIKWWGRKKNG